MPQTTDIFEPLGFQTQGCKDDKINRGDRPNDPGEAQAWIPFTGVDLLPDETISR